MKLSFIATYLIILVVIGNHCTKAGKKTIDANTGSNQKKLLILSAQALPTVSAYLIYNDGTLSSFDILNDKTKKLWNTIVGEPDAEKPSSATKLILNGQLQGLRVKILNGTNKIIDQYLMDNKTQYQFTISNTGCKQLVIYLVAATRVVYENSIDFECE